MIPYTTLSKSCICIAFWDLIRVQRFHPFLLGSPIIFRNEIFWYEIRNDLQYILSNWFTLQFSVACRIPPWHFWKFFLTRNIVILHVLLIYIFIFGWFYFTILNECILEFENFNFPIMHSVVGAIYLLSNDGSEGSFLCEKNIWRKNIPSSRDSSYFRPEMHLLCDNFFSLLN